MTRSPAIGVFFSYGIVDIKSKVGKLIFGIFRRSHFVNSGIIDLDFVDRTILEIEPSLFSFKSGPVNSPSANASSLVDNSSPGGRIQDERSEKSGPCSAIVP